MPPGFVDPPSFLLSMTTLGGEPLAKQRRQARSRRLAGKGQLARRRARRERRSPSSGRFLPRSLKLIKRYTLEPVPPAAAATRTIPATTCSSTSRCRTPATPPQAVAYRLDGPTGLPLEGWWYTHKISQRWFSAAGLRDVVVRFQGNAEQQIDCSTIATGQGRADGPGRVAGLRRRRRRLFFGRLDSRQEVARRRLVRHDRSDPHRPEARRRTRRSASPTSPAA